MNMKMKTITLTKRQIEKITEKAKRLEITFSDMLRRMIDELLDKDEKEERETKAR